MSENKKGLMTARVEGEYALISHNHAGKFKACLEALEAHPHAKELLSAVPSTDVDFWPSDNSWLSSYRPYVVDDGVLQIPVKGDLLNNFPYQAGCYATGYEYIWEAFVRGINDPNVNAIALDIDSPGGLVSGCFSLVDKIYQLKDEKPIYSFANDSAYSAAYAIASLGKTITVNRTGGVGSIGVVMTHYDYSGALQQAGIKITYITAGKHKADGNPTQPLPDDVLERLTARAEDIREIFVETVARNRPVITADEVRATEALCYSAQDAITAKLADTIGEFDEGVEALKSIQPTDYENIENNEDNTEMTDKTEASIDVEKLKMDAKNEGFAEGAKAAQARFSAIVTSPEADGKSKMALHLAANTDLPVESAVATLKVSPLEERPADASANANVFNAAMSAENPNIAALADAAKEEDDMVSSAKAALAFFK